MQYLDLLLHRRRAEYSTVGCRLFPAFFCLSSLLFPLDLSSHFSTILGFSHDILVVSSFVLGSSSILQCLPWWGVARASHKQGLGMEWNRPRLGLPVGDEGVDLLLLFATFSFPAFLHGVQAFEDSLFLVPCCFHCCSLCFFQFICSTLVQEKQICFICCTLFFLTASFCFHSFSGHWLGFQVGGVGAGTRKCFEIAQTAGPSRDLGRRMERRVFLFFQKDAKGNKHNKGFGNFRRVAFLLFSFIFCLSFTLALAWEVFPSVYLSFYFSFISLSSLLCV